MEFSINIPEISAECSLCRRLSSRPPLKLDDTEAFQYEFRRIASFASWPEGTDIHFLEVAKSGLYYIGLGTKVSCFNCELQITVSIPSDDPVEIHKQRNPSCALLQHRDTLNKPICSNSESEDEPDTFELVNGSVDEPASGSVHSPTNRIFDELGYQYYNTHTPLGRPSSLPHISKKRQLSANNQPFVSLPDIGNQIDFSRMEHGATSNALELFQEKRRHQTFQAWPATDKVNPKQLAQLGFFYTGSGDKVQCAFCNGILKNWERNDNIEAEHRKYFSTCPLVRGVETRNVPQPLPTTASAAHSLHQTGASSMTTMICQPLNTELHQSHFDYATRLASFNATKGWKSTNANPVHLAEAGFVYTGTDDNVRCHVCDGGLRNWEPSDIPWVEHARWFPKCGFILSEKGSAFVNEVMKRFPVSPKNAPLQGSIAPAPYYDHALNAEFQTQALSMGFTEAQIKQAVEKNKETQGHTFLSMQSLIDELLVLIENRPMTRDRALTRDHHSASQLEELGANRDAGQTKKPEGNTSLSSEEGKTSQKHKKNKKKKKREKQNIESPLLTLPEVNEESQSLHEENRQLKEQRMCKVCMDAEVNIVFLPCGHLVACAGCAPALRTCPICRALIRGSLRTYLS